MYAQSRFCSWISIHAPRTGSDFRLNQYRQVLPYFNPRSPHGERLLPVPLAPVIKIFQSTLPARGATHCAANRSKVPSYFNPRSPHGERPKGRKCKMSENLFQSTLPARGATRRQQLVYHGLCISIHAPRTGSDRSKSALLSTSSDFNPRSPHGERRTRRQSQMARINHFNPRSPHGERPSRLVKLVRANRFQSTLPARGATSITICGWEFTGDFNPRSPHGERR